MKPEHVAKLLNKSNLTAQEKAVITRTPTTPAQFAVGYDPADDAEFEGFDAFNEAHKGDPRHGGENPLAVVSQTPTGKLWLLAFTINLLGGNPSTVNEDARALLPVLLATKSGAVRTAVFRALRSLLRCCTEDLTSPLRTEINEALESHSRGAVSK
jgi:hypothetical protein